MCARAFLLRRALIRAACTMIVGGEHKWPTSGANRMAITSACRPLYHIARRRVRACWVHCTRAIAFLLYSAKGAYRVRYPFAWVLALTKIPGLLRRVYQMPDLFAWHT